MEEIRKKLNLPEDATEEQIVAELEKREKEKSKLDAKCQELSDSNEGLKSDLEKQKAQYKSLVEETDKEKNKKSQNDENIYSELMR